MRSICQPPHIVVQSIAAHVCVRVCMCATISDRCLLSRPMANADALACFLLVGHYYFFLLASLKLLSQQAALTRTPTPTLSKLAGFLHFGRLTLAHMRSIVMNICTGMFVCECVCVCLGGVCSSDI